MFTTGIVVFVGVLLLMAKLPRRILLRALHYGLLFDLMVTVLVFIVHFGTFSGLMAATVAGLLTSLATSTAKRLFGYIADGRYHPGLIPLNLSR